MNTLRDKNNRSFFTYNDLQYKRKFGSIFSLTTGFSNKFYTIKASALRDLFPGGELDKFKLDELGVYAQGDLTWNKLTVSGGARMEAMIIDGKIREVLSGHLNFWS